MNGINISENKIGQITLTSPDDPLLAAKVKSIPNRRLHPLKKPWNFPNTDGTLVSSRDLVKMENLLD